MLKREGDQQLEQERSRSLAFVFGAGLDPESRFCQKTWSSVI